MQIEGMAHITGGGFYDNIPRILPERIQADIHFDSWEKAPVFSWLKEAGNLSWPEMLQIFNCGIGYILVLPREQAEEAISRIRVFKMPAWQIGEISRRSGDEQVIIDC